MLKQLYFLSLCNLIFSVVAEIKALQSNLTLEQIRAREAKLSTEVRSLDMWPLIKLTIEMFLSGRCSKSFNPVPDKGNGGQADQTTRRSFVGETRRAEGG